MGDGIIYAETPRFLFVNRIYVCFSPSHYVIFFLRILNKYGKVGLPLTRSNTSHHIKKTLVNNFTTYPLIFIVHVVCSII